MVFTSDQLHPQSTLLAQFLFFSLSLLHPTFRTALGHVDIHLDLWRLDITAFLDAGVGVRRSSKRLVCNLLLELLVFATLTKFVHPSVVDLKKASLAFLVFETNSTF